MGLGLELRLAARTGGQLSTAARLQSRVRVGVRVRVRVRVRVKFR